MSEQSTALRLADALNCATDDDCGYCQPCVIAAEMRRLHALNGELLEALNAILNGHGDPDIPEAALAKARAAIAKAERNA
jgi:hypothetical protein